MDLTPYVTTIEDSLAAAAGAGDEGTRRTAAALTAALDPAVRLAIMNALADLALEVTETLGDRVVELRLEGGDVRIAVSPAPGLDDAADATAGRVEPEGELTRITLRIPESLKSKAEQTAAAQGISLNTWLTRAVQESLRGASHPQAGRAPDIHRQRLRGWVQG